MNGFRRAQNLSQRGAWHQTCCLGLRKRLDFFLSFLAWRRFVARTSLRRWPPRWLDPSPVAAGSAREGPPLPGAGPLHPTAFPGTPGSWGTCCRLALGCPGGLILPSLCVHPWAQPAGRDHGCTPPSQPRAGSPGTNRAERERLIFLGWEESTPAAPLALWPWLSVLGGRCQPAGERQQHRCVWQEGTRRRQPGRHRRAKCRRTELTATD